MFFKHIDPRKRIGRYCWTGRLDGAELIRTVTEIRHHELWPHSLQAISDFRRVHRFENMTLDEIYRAASIVDRRDGSRVAVLTQDPCVHGLMAIYAMCAEELSDGAKEIKIFRTMGSARTWLKLNRLISVV